MTEDNDRYWESLAPGAGRRAPRADARTDARTLSLNGTWRFRLCADARGTGSAFLAHGFDDTAWDEIAVPSHWVLERVTTPGAAGPASLRGTADGPLYTNTAFPVPIDPPRVPTENPTGDYRLVFDAPDDWGRSVLRFQGVDSAAKVWLNGEELGWSTGSRLPVEFDAPVRPGRNVLAVRVHRWSAGTYLEDQDMWWLPGIFRDVEVIERPDGAVDDHHVHADYDPATGMGTLRVDADVPGLVEIPELGLRLEAGEEARIAVEPWSAETPRLYRGTLTSRGESIVLAVGFRRVEIQGGVLEVNGAPVFFRGVNRHEHHWDTGRTLDRETMVADVVAMKRHNINAVRTSHYPPHPEFLRLCDEYGLWVVEECDLETHGFIYAGWDGNPASDPRWAAAMLDRVRRMVERDKNRPSVVVWSLANESWVGDNFATLEEWVRRRDPSRPILYERDPSYRNSDFYSLMYPDLERLDAIGRREEDRPEGIDDSADARRRGLPFLLVEYAHAMGNGPGSLADYHAVMRNHERICGGFVWEWIDHGFRQVDAADREFVMHGGDVDYRPNGGRYCLDGLLFADRTPSPALAELAAVLQPLEFEHGAMGLTVRNARDHADTADLSLRWRLELDGRTLDTGSLDLPVLGPRDEAVLPLPTSAGEDPGEWWVTVEAVLRDGALWAPAGHVVARHQVLLADVPRRQRSSRVLPPSVPLSGGDIELGPGRFDSATGRLISLGGIPVDGPLLDLYRAPTENDRGQGGRNNLAAVWSAVGLDRMLHRTDAVEVAGDALVVRSRVAAATHPHAAGVQYRWSADDDALRLDVTVDFLGPWTDTPYQQRDIAVPRLGLRLGLPGDYGGLAWFGRGPDESYRDSRSAALVGRYEAAIDDLQVGYPVPQENGNHMDTRWLEITGAPGLPRLRVEGLPRFDFTARRWTSEDLERARHPHDLRDTGRVWVNLDHAQAGLGSASVGPALPERYRIPRRRTAWSLRFVTTL
ncbi:hypothetical protein BCR15_07735 [Tessaracoccus lapidicaptus]|uniref:Beta-galactosidase n=1 Tax=Tessaracoccus lapidicaptus TaxID=1427523 RepID=A0A1C0AIK2_9ACTN|nr:MULTISPECIES: glycoside hydrolase family 2 TIM barrel-domain containing protein [Tessaracoccus]AQX15655.1 hypothetical protein BKM78_06820 [Tessaracoccus sp. T2.5-30]OCL31938.1 hypothetical protein BCR15_07735 [Tessaracoccus lapidicaptus]VEP40035.1 Beta-galactosidase [Tessaracoccus lapidicaptus]